MKYAILILYVASFSPIAVEAAENDRLDHLESKLAALTKRVAALESENRQLRANATPDLPEHRDADPMSSGVNIDGDFRYRYETIDEEGVDRHSRSRIRARVSVEGSIAPALRIGAGLATGGDSPTSSTQTLGNGGSKKDVALDLAYIDWTPYSGLHLLAGKFRNPLFQVPSQTLLWDDEWRPEGVVVRYENDRVFAAVLGSWLESDSAAPALEWSVGAHAGIYRPLGEARLTAGAGYFEIDTAGKGTFFGSDTAFAGNSFGCADPLNSASCVYLWNYREVELFGALDFEQGAYDAKIYGHYVKNLDADRFDSGWTLGARIKTGWKNQPLQFDYFYRSLGADAIYAQLTDSDFGGGGSDAEGHYFKAAWWANPAWQLSLTWFDNHIGADTGIARRYDRLQLNADFHY